MSALPETRTLTLPEGRSARVQEQGQGEPLVFLGGLLGLPRWPDFLTALARSRRVIAPSLPGQPGCERFRDLDDTLDWVSAVLDLLDACAPERVDLVGASLGGALAAEVAALARERVKRLALVAPLGVSLPEEPVADLWAQRRKEFAPLVSEEPEALDAFLAAPEDADPVEWQIVTTRSQEAAARLLWPFCDTGLARRLHRIRCESLLVWGERDRVIPASHAKHLADAIAGPVEIRSVAGAGHTAELDRPDAVANAVLAFLD